MEGTAPLPAHSHIYHKPISHIAQRCVVLQQSALFNIALITHTLAEPGGIVQTQVEWCLHLRFPAPPSYSVAPRGASAISRVQYSIDDPHTSGARQNHADSGRMASLTFAFRRQHHWINSFTEKMKMLINNSCTIDSGRIHALSKEISHAYIIMAKHS